MTGKREDSDPARRQPDEAADDQEVIDRLPPAPRRSDRDFRGHSTDFRVDILDHGDQVIVVAELPGADESAINIRLLNPQTLRITAKRAGPVAEGYYVQERGGSTLSRLIRLPASVTGEAAKTGYRNGVLEVRLTKVPINHPDPGGKEIPIE
ncbi:MAG: Hsp20/alpha crystallin family protein [Methanoculleus sp.]|nr:Hsp20/alpha crystallin family protein [Methanomicrobiales archaeon]